MACKSNNNQYSVKKFDKEISKIISIQNNEHRNVEADSLWAKLTRNNQVPLTDNETALFLYKGNAEKVSWHGDFNNWSNDINQENKGIRIEGTDLWSLKMQFPSDARIDYKINVDGDWILDPANNNEQWSGFGPNSELRMPKWKANEITKKMDNINEGALSGFKKIRSNQLGYSVQYQVYTPFGYTDMDNLPVLYVTDGSEYNNDKMGAMINVLDNLMHTNKINPIIVVFVDTRAPEDLSINRRIDQFSINTAFKSFFVDTLIPEIKSNYKITNQNNATGIIGTSMGGLNATYFGFTEPDIFQNIAIQSPAYWFNDEIYTIVKDAGKWPNKIYLSVGTIGDSLEDTQKMKNIFDNKNINYKYLEVNEGHSWGAWSQQLDKILIHFYGK